MQNQQLPYFSFKQYLKRQYGENVWKIPVHVPFTCPNRDGKVGTGGCIYCRNDAFSPGLRLNEKTVAGQIQQGIQRIRSKKSIYKFLVYFQSYTNTYAEVSELKKFYDQAMDFEEVVGLAIGTRPDCISEEILDLIENYTKKTDIWLEYGLQSSHDETLGKINRGHTFADFLKAIELTKGRKINICVHIIIGLPGETKSMILETAAELAKLPIHGLKIHPMQVHRGTVLEEMFQRREVVLMSRDEYIEICCDFLERMPENLVIQRLTADAPKSLLVAPEWCENKMAVLQAIQKEFYRRKTRQGSKYSVRIF